MSQLTEGEIAATEARLADLRAAVASGPVTLEQAAATLGIPAPDLMAMLALHELRARPNCAAIIAGADGVTMVRMLADGSISMTTTPALAQILLTGLLTDPATTLSIAAPLPIAETKGAH